MHGSFSTALHSYSERMSGTGMLSVRPSVWYQMEINDRWNIRFSPSGSPGSLIFGIKFDTYVTGEHPLRGKTMKKCRFLRMQVAEVSQKNRTATINMT